MAKEGIDNLKEAIDYLTRLEQHIKNLNVFSVKDKHDNYTKPSKDFKRNKWSKYHKTSINLDNECIYQNKIREQRKEDDKKEINHCITK